MAASALNTTKIKGSLDVLTTENGEIPEYLINGVPVGDGAAYKIVEAVTDYTMLTPDDLIIVTGTATITLVNPATHGIHVTVRNISGTTTLATAAGTIETTTLTTGQSATLAPRASGWFVI